MSQHILKRHNKTLLLYHMVFAAKYPRKVLSETLAASLKEICLAIAQHYQTQCIEIGMDEDHIHFLLESVPFSWHRLHPASFKNLANVCLGAILDRNNEVSFYLSMFVLFPLI